MDLEDLRRRLAEEPGRLDLRLDLARHSSVPSRPGPPGPAPRAAGEARPWPPEED